MPVLSPECVYDNIITRLGDFEGGSIAWNAAYSGYRYDLFIKIPNVLHITSSELSTLDHTTHNSAVSGLKKKLFTLTPEIDFFVSIYCTHFDGGFPYGSYTGDTVSVCGLIKHGNTYYYPSGVSTQVFPYLSTAGGYVSSGQSEAVNSMACPVNIVKNYGIKFILLTNYAYGNPVAVEGETKAAYLQINCFIPCQSSQNPSGYQSFAHIKPGVFFQTRESGEPIDWISNNQYTYFGYVDNLSTGFGTVFSSYDMNDFENRLKQIAPYDGSIVNVGPPEDVPPSQEDDPSGPGGGGGDQDPSSDPIPFPDLPTGGALSSGAIQAFEVTPAALTQMFNKLWNTSMFDISTFQKLVEAPLDSLIQLQCVPFNPTTSGSGFIKLGNFDTEAIGDKITQEYYTIDCGTLKLDEYWGSALDYSPYTKAEIFIPMIGFRELDINDIMGKTIHLKYNYSIFDGNLTAQLMCGNAVIYKWPGNVKETIPVTAKVSDALQRVVSGAMGALSSGSGAGMAAAAIGAAVNVAMSKTHVSRTGEMSGSTGLLDDFSPFLVLHRPIQSLAENFKGNKGYPSNITSVLGSLSGYTEVEYIHLTGIRATDSELEEIETLLKEGVII